MNEIFTVALGEWQVCLDGKVLPTVWNSRGAALAGMKTEMNRAAKKSRTQGTPLTGSQILAALESKMTPEEIRSRIAEKRLDEGMNIIKSTMNCLHEIHDEVFAAPTPTTEGEAK